MSGQTEPIDVLIDAARDCLVYLAANHTATAANWCDLLINSDVPILRRLSMHTLPLRQNLTADQKVDWVLNHRGLNDLTARRETYQAVANIYPGTSENKRIALIGTILAYAWPFAGHGDKEWLAAREQFGWLRHIQNADSNCEYARQAVNEILEKYPDFENLEAHDGTRLSLSTRPFLRQGAVSPWSVGDLLSRCPCEWVEDLLGFDGEEGGPFGPNREGLLKNVGEAAIQNFDWGIGLADKLVESGNWDADLWAALIEAWTRELNEDKHLSVLSCLANRELYSIHTNAVAKFLLAVVKDGGWPYASTLLEYAFPLASDVWRILDRDEQEPDADDYLLYATDHPAGSVALFWLHSLSLTRSQQVTTPNNLEQEYDVAFTRVIDDESIVGILGKTILASQLPFLLAVDETWTRDNMIQLFKEPDSSHFRPVWHGFLYTSLNPHVAELLHDALLQAIPHAGSIFPRRIWHLRREFVRLCIDMIIYFVEDPVDSWIPAIFLHSETDDKLQFAWCVGQALEEREDSESETWWNQWLKRYWLNRIQGVPTALEPKEVGAMLDWLKHLDGVYPQAVECSILMLQTRLEETTIIRDLNQSGLWSKYPRETTELVLKLAESDPLPWVWHDGDILTERLLEQNIDQDLKARLEELRARLSLDTRPQE